MAELEDGDPFKEFGGSVVTKEEDEKDPFAEFGGKGLKKKAVKSDIGGQSSVIGSSNPLNPATVRMPNNFNFAQQEDPETYNKVQAERQSSQQEQGFRKANTIPTQQVAPIVTVEDEIEYGNKVARNNKRLEEVKSRQGIGGSIADAAKSGLATIGAMASSIPAGIIDTYGSMNESNTGALGALGIAADWLKDMKIGDGKSLASQYLTKTLGAPLNLQSELEELSKNPVDAEEIGKRAEKYLGLPEEYNPLSPNNGAVEYLLKVAKTNDERAKNGYSGGISQAISDGNYKDAWKLTAINTVQSLPIMLGLVAARGAGASEGLSLAGLGVGTAETEYKKLKEENPNIDRNLLKLNAQLTGLGESGSEIVGTSLLFNQGRRLFQSGAKEEAEKVIKDGVNQFLNTAFKRSFVGSAALADSGGEMANQVWKNAVDKWSGVDPDRDYTDNVLDAGIISLATTGGVAGVTKGMASVIKPKAKASVTQDIQNIEQINADIENPDIDDATREALLEQSGNLTEKVNDEIEKAEKETSKLTPEQQLEAVKVNENIDELQAIVDNPNVSETTKKVIQTQIDDLTKQVEAIKPVEAPKEAVQETKTPEPTETTTEVKETIVEPVKGVDEVYDTPDSEVSKVGTKDQYSEYLKSIFPDSEVQNVAYHDTNNEFEDFNKAENGIFTTGQKDWWQKFKYKRKMLINTGKVMRVEGGINSDITKEIFDKNPDVDTIITVGNTNDIGEGVYVVRDPSQIHELGTKKDIQAFKEFVDKNKTNEVKQPEVAAEEVVEEDLPQKRTEEVLAKAETDLAALKQVKDKGIKYEASMKRLTEAKNAKEITTSEFNDLKKRFDDVIGESTPATAPVKEVSPIETISKKPVKDMSDTEVDDEIRKIRELLEEDNNLAKTSTHTEAVSTESEQVTPETTKSFESIPTALKDIRDYYSKDERAARTLDLLDRVLANNKDIQFDTNAKVDAKFDGLFNTETGKISLNLNNLTNKEALYRTALHEMMHAASSKEINTNKAFQKEIRFVLDALRKELKLPADGKVINKLVELGYVDANNNYGAVNEHELISEVFTNPKFNEMLKGIKYEGDSLLKKLYEAILSFFNKQYGNLKAAKSELDVDNLADFLVGLTEKTINENSVGTSSNTVLPSLASSDKEALRQRLKELEENLKSRKASTENVETQEPDVEEVESSEKKKRSATQRVLKSNEYSQEFKDAISEEAIYYSELPNTITDAEAEAFIDVKGEIEAEDAIMDFNNAIGSAVRFSVMQKLIDRFEANGEYLRAAEMAEKLYYKATDYGQGIQIFSTFPKLSKIGQVQIAKKNIEEQRKKFKKQTEKTTNKISKEFKKANKEAATETVENVKKKIEQATVVTPEGTIKELPMYGSKNKVFTRDKYLKAKQKLRGVSMSSFGGLPIDDVINIAGYHIEATGRDFARFSRRMKADLGSKIKPYLKDIYAQTRKTLIDDGYDESLFLSDEEVQAQINEDEGQKYKEKLEKAIQRKDAKEQKLAIKKLQEVSKEEGVWGQYKESAASRLKNMVLTNAEKDISGDPSLQQFTDGLVKNMKAKMAELLPEQPKKPQIVRPDIEIIGDAYKNFEKYKEVWEATQKEFQDKYADQPEVLQAIDEYFGEILDKPFSDKLIERSVNKGLSEMDKNIADLVVQHYTVLDNAKQSLTDKLINDAGLTGSEAASLAKAVETEFDRIATKKKQQILEKIFSKKERKKPAVKTLEGDLIKMSNLGAFRTDDVVNMYGDKMGWPTLTQENIKEIERLSDIVQNTTDTIKKRRAVEDLLGYQAKIKGNSITDLVTSVWYANVLSGYNTQVVNFGANAINTALLYANAVAQRPKDGVFLAKGLINGMYRGFLEAEETLRTGYSPIKGKAEVPTLLELKRFVGGAKNPLNYLKYVRRVMIAADVLFFEGQKEMRAYQLAKMQASNEGKLDPTLNQMNRAIELVGKSDRQVETIKEQVELEYQQELSEIENMPVTAKEKNALLRQAKSDKERRIFDLIEQQRSSDLIQETAEYASVGTYNYQPKGGLGAIANGINTIVKDIPVLRYAVPFTNIIANVANETIDYTPLGFLRRSKGGFSNFRREALTDQQKADLTTKAAIGTTLMATMFILSNVKGDDDEPVLEITGNGTGDYAKNETLKQTGWQPYSFRFKLPNVKYSAWYSYQYSPLIAVLGYVGHVNDLSKYKKEDDNDTVITKMSKAAGLTVSTFFQGTYLDGVGDILANVLDPRASEKVTDKLIKGTLGAAKGVVLPNLYSQSAQTLESVFDIPKKEVRETLSGQLLQDIPYARNMFYDKINILGDPIMPDTDKFTSIGKPNKIIQMLIDKKAVFAPINRKAEKIYDVEEGKERVLNDEEFYEYSKAKGQFIKEALTERYDELVKMNDYMFKKELTSIKKDATKMARYEIMDIDGSLIEIKVEIDNEVKTYELSSDQIKERQKINTEYISKNADRMKPSLVSKYVNQGLSRSKADKKADLDIQKKANTYSRNKMISNDKRENDGKITFKEKD